MSHVVDALRLRTWAIQVLSTGWTPPPDVGTPAWKLFLKAERCAIALSTRAEGDAPPLLHATATIELQRVLSARGQIEELGRQAAAAGTRVVVLKGGLMALAGPGVDLVDIDVLAEPQGAPRVAALLDTHGYVAEPGGGSGAHLPQRHQPFAVHVEVHHSLTELPAAELWARAESIPRKPGLWRPAPIDQVWHALVHSAVTHPFRRGTLRDLFLISWADRLLEADGQGALEARISGHPQAMILREVLRLARDLRDNRAPVDAFRREAAAQYLIIGAPGLGGEWGLRPNVTKSVYALLDGAAARRAYWGHVWFGTAPTSPWRVLATAESVWPWGGKVLRRTMRVLRAPVVELVAVPIALRAARLGNAHEVREARTLDIRSGEP